VITFQLTYDVAYLAEYIAEAKHLNAKHIVCLTGSQLGRGLFFAHLVAHLLYQAHLLTHLTHLFLPLPQQDDPYSDSLTKPLTLPGNGTGNGSQSHQSPSTRFGSSSATNRLFLETSPEELAKQLTLIDWTIFSRITSKELKPGQWTGPMKHMLSPNVVAFTRRFNIVSNSLTDSLTVSPTDSLTFSSHQIAFLLDLRRNPRLISAQKACRNSSILHQSLQLSDRTSKSERCLRNLLHTDVRADLQTDQNMEFTVQERQRSIRRDRTAVRSERERFKAKETHGQSTGQSAVELHSESDNLSSWHSSSWQFLSFNWRGKD